jgi:phage terminase large subunit
MEKPKIKVNPKYRPLYTNKDKFIFLVTGGRGSAKSFNVSTFTERLSFEAGHKILFSRYTMSSADISVIPEFKQKIDLDGYAHHFKVTNQDIINLFSDSEIMFRGIKTSSGNQTANLKSIQGLTTFIGDEMEEWQSEDDYDSLILSIRTVGRQNRVILIMNPSDEEHFIYQKYIKDTHRIEVIDGVEVQISTHPNVCHIHTTYLDNLEHLAQNFIDEINEMKAKNLKKYGHKVIGRWKKKNDEDALWTDVIIEGTRVKEAPRFKRIVVAIDPAVTSKDTSDETGIVAVGLGFDNHLYPLEDVSGIYTPTDWCKAAIMLYRKYKADRIVGEVNNGGDLIETVLRTIDKNIPYTGVHATRDKFTRAEPVSALYEQGKAHHVGILLELEYEMTTWAAKQGDKSPNRIDALVWAAAELLPEMSKKPGLGVRALSGV